MRRLRLLPIAVGLLLIGLNVVDRRRAGSFGAHRADYREREFTILRTQLKKERVGAKVRKPYAVIQDGGAEVWLPAQGMVSRERPLEVPAAGSKVRLLVNPAASGWLIDGYDLRYLPADLQPGDIDKPIALRLLGAVFLAIGFIPKPAAKDGDRVVGNQSSPT